MTESLQRYYRVMEVPETATLDEISESYKVLVKVWHPDRFAHDKALQRKAQEKLKEINQAYDRLRQARAFSGECELSGRPARTVAGRGPGGEFAEAAKGVPAGRGFWLYAVLTIVLGLAFSAYVFSRFGSGTVVAGNGKMVIEDVTGGDAEETNTVRSSSPVVRDDGQGLAWMSDGRHWNKPVSFEEASVLLRRMNATAYGGLRSWRLPTSDELVGLARGPEDFKDRFSNLEGFYLSSTPAVHRGYTIAVSAESGRKRHAWKSGASGFFLLPVCELSN